MDAARSNPEAPPRLNPDQWSDWKWRLSNLYWIVTDDGEEVPFRPNEMQLQFIEELWYLNVILKARQHGFTTLIDVLGLDQCVFNSNTAAGIIAHTREAAEAIFRNKVLFPYKKLPDGLRQARTLEKDTGKELVFDNGSSIGVGTSMRSGTLQFLHVSEFGKIAAKFPEKAREIKTGSFNTVHAGQFIFVESTAEGAGGDYFDMVKKARKLAELVAAGSARLTEMDFKFHFYPWYLKSEYRLDPTGVPIPDSYRKYFAELEVFHGISLMPAQQAWYVKKAEMLTREGKDDLDMKREFPSTSDEAFQVAVHGTYYGPQMAQARKQNRVRQVPHVPGMPVNTFWDLGRNDTTAIWFHQYIASEHRFPKCYENSGEDLAHYVKVLQDTGYLFGKHYLPHDADNENLERGESRVDRLVELGIPREKIIVVPRVEDVNVGIELTRAILPLCYFDLEGCEDGIRALESYKKLWDDKLATYRQEPLHDWASNYADALRQFAQGWNAPPKQSGKKPRPRNWRTT